VPTKGERELVRIPSVAADTTSDDVRSEDQIAIAIPGIRTDGTWIDHASMRVNRWTRSITILKAGPNRISSVHLFTRLGLAKIRQAIRTDVSNTIIRYKSTHRVSVICHSMGASLFSELLDEIDYKFDTVIFLGSVCHRNAALKIRKHCNIFVNQCGTQDLWPVIAEVVNPWKYSATGTIGFKRPYSNDIFFDNDHFTCTEEAHMDKYVIPLIYGAEIEAPMKVNVKYSSTSVKYLRIYIILIFVLFGLLIYGIT
jgi:hypothetical protein